MLLASFVAFIPGILAYLTYIFVSDRSIEDINIYDVILILFYSLILEQVRSVIVGSHIYVFFLFYFLIIPVLLGVLSDLVMRALVGTPLELYRYGLIEEFDFLKDTSDVPRWQRETKNTANMQ